MKKKQPEKMEDLVAVPTPNYDLTIGNTVNLDLHIDVDPYSIKIVSTQKWYKRLWIIISNPFYYIFKGYIRY